MQVDLIYNKKNDNFENSNKITLYDQEIAEKLGIGPARVLHQIKYWLKTTAGKVINGHKWIYNTQPQWAAQLRMPLRSLQRATEILVSAGILQTSCCHENKHNRTKWYTVDFQREKEVLSTELSTDNGDKPTNPITACPQSDSAKKQTPLSPHSSSYRQIGGMYIHNTNNKDILRGDFEFSKNSEQPDLTKWTPDPTKWKKKTSSLKDRLKGALGKIFPKHHLMPTKHQELLSTCRNEGFKAHENASISKAIDFVKEMAAKSSFSGLAKTINQSQLFHVIRRHQKKFWGTDRDWFERFKEYIIQLFTHPILTGKQAMRDGNFFKLSVGTIFSSRLINQFLDKTGFFKWVYKPSDRPPVSDDLPPGENETDDVQSDNPDAVEPIDVKKDSLLEKKLSFLTKDMVETSAFSEEDKRMKVALYHELGEEVYKTWFHLNGFVFQGMDDRNQPIFKLTSPFARDYILTHYANEFEKALRSVKYTIH